jgi:lipopolysaccharide/colanic/teichoic acid biosynthesis glycosyltransferase/predicted ATP-grasp superfamily ATP-dependent carboligase
MRRAVDIAVAIVLMVAVAPAAAIVSILILIRMGRPVLFRQHRVGRDGAVFTVVKFRTMRPERWPGEPDDQRTPRLGTLLRASSLDELPQLWNILRGDMSLIGPRPTVPEQVEHYTSRQRRRLAIRPGLTGWAQVNGRNSISWPERIELDLWYIEHRSVPLDMKILLRTGARLVKPEDVIGKDGINPDFPVPAPADPPELELPAQKKSAQRKPAQRKPAQRKDGRPGADGAPRSVSRVAGIVGLMRGRGQAAPPAVVLGRSCIETVRPLALAGIRSLVVAPAREGSQYSRHARALTDWNWSGSARDREPELLDRILRFAGQQPEPLALMYCCEASLLFVSRNRSRLQDVFRFVVPQAETVEQLADKGRFVALADRLALPVPRTRLLPLGQAISGRNHDDLQFPLFVKPAHRDRVWESIEGTKGVRVDSLADLRSMADRHPRVDSTFVLQQLVDGPESAIESYHVYVDRAGEVVGEFTGRKLRTLPALYGYTTALTTTHNQDVLDLGRKIVHALDFTGVAKFDFKRSPTGQLFLLEINARFSLWHHVGARVGVNIPALVYADLMGGLRPESRGPEPRAEARDAATWVHPKDVFAARASGMRLAEWTRWAARSEAKAYWSISDPMPLLITSIARTMPRERP